MYCGLMVSCIPLFKLGEARPLALLLAAEAARSAAAAAAAAGVKFNAGGLGGLSFGMGLRLSVGVGLFPVPGPPLPSPSWSCLCSGLWSCSPFISVSLSLHPSESSNWDFHLECSVRPPPPPWVMAADKLSSSIMAIWVMLLSPVPPPPVPRVEDDIPCAPVFRNLKEVVRPEPDMVFNLRCLCRSMVPPRTPKTSGLSLACCAVTMLLSFGTVRGDGEGGSSPPTCPLRVVGSIPASATFVDAALADFSLRCKVEPPFSAITASPSGSKLASVGFCCEFKPVGIMADLLALLLSGMGMAGDCGEFTPEPAMPVAEVFLGDKSGG